MSQADFVMSTTVDVSPTQQWRVDIGQCPQFAVVYATTSPSRYLVWVYIGIVTLTAGLCIAGVMFLARLHEKDINLRVAIAKHEESTRAHRWIIGYGMSAACPQPAAPNARNSR